MSIRFLDILDILIVGMLFFKIYKMIKNSLTFYIFLGILIIVIVWWIVSFLKMELLSLFFSQILSVGAIALIIIFQPELRKFLLMLGNQTMMGEWPIFNKIMKNVGYKVAKDEDPSVMHIQSALLRMAKEKTGALVIILNDININSIQSSGILMNSEISKELIISIFNKDSPLHDGAMVLIKDKIHKVSCILPVSDSLKIPSSAGLRHRAGLGITEVSPAHAFIVSEETGKISYANRGIIQMYIDDEKLTSFLKIAIASP